MATFAGELVQPYKLDTTNAYTTMLLDAGVSVFISDDNLTTVTNVLTGVAGTPTDITNNEQGVPQGDYRIGYDTSGLSAQAQTDLDADPYQIFQTAEAQSLENKIVTATGSYITDDQLGDIRGSTVKIVFTDFKFQRPINSSQAEYIFAQTSDTSANRELAFYVFQGTLKAYLGGTSYDLQGQNGYQTAYDGILEGAEVIFEYDGTNFRIRRDGAQYGDDKAATWGANRSATTELNIFSRNGGQFTSQAGNHFSTCAVYINGVLTRFYDATNGTEVVELISGRRPTLTGFQVGSFTPVIPVEVFTDADYTTLQLFANNQNFMDYHAKYQPTTTTGATISGFANGLTIDGGTVSSTVTLTTTGSTFIQNLTADDIDATGAVAVYINNCEVADVTG